MKLLFLAARHLFRNRRRSILTFFAIAVSTLVFTALMSLPGLVDAALRDPARSFRLIVHAKAGLFHLLPEAYAHRIRSAPHVEAVIGSNIFMSFYRQPDQPVAALALDPGPVAKLFPDFGISDADAVKFRRDRTAALVGAGLMRAFHWRLGDTVTLRGANYPIDAEIKIVGIVDALGVRDNVLMRRDYLEELLGRPATVNMFWVRIDRTESAPAAIKTIDDMFANSAAQTDTESELAFAQSQMSDYRVLFDGVKFLAAIVMFSIGLVATNTGAMSVRERRSEIAVLRALGYSRSVVVATFVAEGLAIALPAGLLGCAGAYGLLKLAVYGSGTLGPIAMNLELSLRVIVLSIIAAAAIGVIASVVPAVNAVRRSIVESLRDVR
ncbi:MAG: ABC transporter permease [Candidatus Binataceae bacterium]